jgi:hypothetical protein
MSNDSFGAIMVGLRALHMIASGIESWNGDLSREFIDAGDYGLALEGIACAYLDNGKTMPADVFNIFEWLAVSMELEQDEEHEGVKELLAEGRAK